MRTLPFLAAIVFVVTSWTSPQRGFAEGVGYHYFTGCESQGCSDGCNCTNRSGDDSGSGAAGLADDFGSFGLLAGSVGVTPGSVSAASGAAASRLYRLGLLSPHRFRRAFAVVDLRSIQRENGCHCGPRGA
jgi:hypothetical protein